ncbi:MAG TPA: hypothetical protein VGM98_10300 [Schlesneria sp.]|jgi:hypothetical protein
MTTRFLIVCSILLASFRLVTAEESSTIGFDTGDSPIVREAANRIEKALKEGVDCDFKDSPLEEVLEGLEKAHRISIWLDKQALQDDGVAMDQQVTLVKSNITFQTALTLILEPLGLTSINQDGILKVTTAAKADEIMTTRVYPVADLINTPSGGENYTSLIVVFQQNTSGKWVDLDQEGGTATPFPNAQAMVVRQTQKIHRQIEGILTALRKVKRLQHLSSIPADIDDPDALNTIDPTPRRRRSAPRTPRSTQSWQQPRVHAND